MPQRPAAIVEEFDDDTDLPLPTHHLPNTGSRGALLEEIGSDAVHAASSAPSDSEDDEAPSLQPVPSAARAPGNKSMPIKRDPHVVQTTDVTPYKTWTCVYPIYLDAKRPYRSGGRRVPRVDALWWPLSQDMADAARKLGLPLLHEVGVARAGGRVRISVPLVLTHFLQPNKAHPRDWENPGRIKVLWRKDGRLTTPFVNSKKQLYLALAGQIHRLKPELKPAPDAAPAPIEPTAVAKSKTGKQGLRPVRKSTGPRLPKPPEPTPPLSQRLSPYSPALPSGILIETVKAGMNATAGQGDAAAPGPSNKGKKKVIRVRG